MSNRSLRRMSEGDVLGIMNARSGQIRDATAEQQALEERRVFADRVQNYLGYTPLAAAIQHESITVPVDVVLMRTLWNLGIRPLDRASVLKYQRRAIKAMHNVLLTLFGWPMLIVGLIGSILVISNGMSEAIGSHDSTFAAMRHGGWVWPALFGFGFAFVLIEHRIVPRSVWRVLNLKDHSRFGLNGTALLPRAALEIALQVQEKVPSALFFVHSLTHEYGSWRIVPSPDPFLEVRFGSETYFVAVWDEPGFDGRLAAVE